MQDKNLLLPQWFSSIELWHNQRIKPSKSTWISCYGIPLNAWNTQTFVSIGKLDESTAESIAFDKGRMFIVTDFLECINEVIHVKIKGDIFPIKVIEDPMAETSWGNQVFTSIKIRNGDNRKKSDVDAVQR